VKSFHFLGFLGNGKGFSGEFFVLRLVVLKEGMECLHEFTFFRNNAIKKEAKKT